MHGLPFFFDALTNALRVHAPALVLRLGGLPSPSPGDLRAFVEEEVARHLADRYEALLLDLLARCSFWFTVETYRALPVLLPHVKRDNACRKEKCAKHVKGARKLSGEARDRWSMPSPDGYLRDDNSLIKSLVSTASVASEEPNVHGARLKAGFVACHIWPMSGVDDPWWNSFIPNLVWLPKPLDVLSDRAGHFVQRALQAQSTARYRDIRTTAAALTETLWARIPRGTTGRLFPVRHEFKVSAKWLASRREKIDTFDAVLSGYARGTAHSGTTGHSHYDQHLRDLKSGEYPSVDGRSMPG